MSNIREWRERIRTAEEKRVGDIYRECIARGCKKEFLQSFDTRIWLFPVEQTRLFLERRSNENAYNEEKHLKQWQTYLQVILEKRPNHEKATEWKESLEIIKKAQNK